MPDCLPVCLELDFRCLRVTNTLMKISRNGLLLMATAALLFSIMSALAKYAAVTLPSAEVVFYRSLIATICLLMIHLLRSERGPLLGHQHGPLVLRGLFGAMALLLYFYSLSGLAVADALLLNQCSPLFVLFLAVPFLGESIRPIQYLLAALALAGVVLVIRPNLEVLNWYGLAAFGSAALAGAAYVCVRKVTRREQAHVVVLYFSVISVASAIPFMLQTYAWPDGSTWLALAAIGVLSVFAQLLLTYAYRYDRAGRVAMAGYLGPLFAALWDALFWDRLPGWMTMLGAALIICSLILLHRGGTSVMDRK